MYQQITIVGNVGRDPELRYTTSGSPVCDFSVAVNERWTDSQTNEQKDKTTWFRVTCWNRLAETVNQYVQKGRQVLVVGTIDASAWTDQQGEARASLELTARTVKFLGQRDTAPDWGDAGDRPQGAQNADIPF
jgi:single-strand DNA-binding protein